MPRRRLIVRRPRAVVGRPYFFIDFQRNRRLNRRQPDEVMVRQREYQHDAVVLTYRGRNVRGIDVGWRFRKGTPIAVRWGWAPKELETFYGYVHSTKKVRRSKTIKEDKLEVYLVSASYRMNKTRMRTFRRMKVGAMIARIARQHRFTTRMDPSSRYHFRIPQLGMSDWRLMVRLAKDIGFTLHCKRTEVQFKRRLINTRANGRQPTFRWFGGGGPSRGALLSFTHKAGTAPLVRNRRMVIGGMDDNGKQFWAHNGGDCCEDQPDFTEYFLDEAVTSIHEGRKKLSGLSGLNRFYVIGSAEVSGVPKLRCGETVRFLDTGPEVQGYWWVGGVEHRLTGVVPGRPMKYTMNLEVGRETMDQIVCVTLPPPTSWSGKPEVIDPCGAPLNSVIEPEVPTVYNPTDDCPPLEVPDHGTGKCHCPPKKCPGTARPLRTTVKLRGQRKPARLDRWSAQVVSKKKPGVALGRQRTRRRR